MLDNFEEYEAYVINDVMESLDNLMGIAIIDGEMVGFDGEFYDGVRGNDHNMIKSGLEFDTWEDLHNAIPFVRLVPESMTALVKGLSVGNEVLEAVKAYGYTVEAY